MTIDEVIYALERVKDKFKLDNMTLLSDPPQKATTKGGYFRIGDVAIKIAEITELK